MKMPRGLEVSLPEELQPAVLEPALIVDWLARWFSLWLLLCGGSLKVKITFGCGQGGGEGYGGGAD